MRSESFKLSILLVTYNHEKYIRQALNSLFRQVTEDPIELIIADDGSTDHTLAIIKEFEFVEPRFQFKYLDNTINVGITKNYKRGFAACTGRYVAVLEGDDYWVSPTKLKRQLAFLDDHWECDLCSVNYFVYEEDRAQFTPRVPIGFGHRHVGARDLIADNLVGNFSTCVYRKAALESLPDELFDLCSYDWIINICVAQGSLVGFIEEPLSVYRLHSAGVWTQTPHIEKLRVQLELIPAYDKLTRHLYHADFEALACRLRNLIGMIHVNHAVVAASQPIGRVFPRLIDYLPPGLMMLLRLLVPPKVKRLMVRLLVKGV